jgi:preprotein translocase SecE subunit
MKGKFLATPKPTSKKPRIRKTAPSLREMAQEAQAKQQKVVEASKGSKSTFFVALKRIRGLKGAGKVMGVFGWLMPKYFINSWREVREVTWPTRKETWRLTLAVFVFAIVFGALVAGVDKGLDVLFKKLVLR